MDSIVIKVKDFTQTPGPRYIKEDIRDGRNSGELFREEVLYPALLKAISEHKTLVVDLDQTEGYGTSFLEESFGGLIREKKMEYKTIIDNIKIVSNEEPFLIDDIKNYLNDAHQKDQG